MASFLNLSLDGNINTNFLVKHILFLLLWVVGISIFIFRVDILLTEGYLTLRWLKLSMPTLFFLFLFACLAFLKWYYILAFFFYPLLLFFWFIPKTILRKGKIYLFGSYLTSIFSKLSNFKVTLFYFFWLVLAMVFLMTISQNWTRWLAVITLSYFYTRYVYQLVKGSFQQPSLFGKDLEEKIQEICKKSSPEDSLIIKSYVNREGDKKLELTERREKQMRRTIIANHALELVTNKLNGLKGRKAFVILWMFGAFKFLVYSLLYFWFLNFQLYKIDVTNFAYNGSIPLFDFLYYTLKTVTFGDIDLIKPLSVLARISELSSFLTIGIFLFVIFISVIVSLKEEKMNEDVKLTTDLFNNENLTLSTYFKDEFGVELKSAIGEVKNIDDSLKNLKKIIDKVF